MHNITHVENQRIKICTISNLMEKILIIGKIIIYVALSKRQTHVQKKISKMKLKYFWLTTFLVEGIAKL